MFYVGHRISQMLGVVVRIEGGDVFGGDLDGASLYGPRELRSPEPGGALRSSALKSICHFHGELSIPDISIHSARAADANQILDPKHRLAMCLELALPAFTVPCSLPPS